MQVPETRPIHRIKAPFDIELFLPGSKSLALRQVFMAALADTPSRLAGLPACEDLTAMLGALEKFGVTFEPQHGGLLVSPPAGFHAKPVSLDLNMSGVSLRFLLAFAALRPAPTRFDGHESLRARPNGELLDALQQLGCQVTSNNGKLPIEVIGPQKPARCVRVDGRVSSQYLSALLLIAPCLPAGLSIELTGELTSVPYVGLTRLEMAKRGATVRSKTPGYFRVPPTGYRGTTKASVHSPPKTYGIEGDATAATYFAALATLHGSTVRFNNLGAFTRQGDYAFFDLCRRLGATATASDDITVIRGASGALKAPGEVDFTEMPDAAPTFMALAPFLPKPTTLTGLGTLRFKECDRIAAMATELRKCGVTVSDGVDWMVIHPRGKFERTTFDTYHDHRIAMSLAVLASRAGGCEIADPACVNKTYVNFWRDFDCLYNAVNFALAPNVS